MGRTIPTSLIHVHVRLLCALRLDSLSFGLRLQDEWQHVLELLQEFAAKKLVPDTAGGS